MSAKVAHKHRRALFCLAAISLIAAACSGAEPESETKLSPGQSGQVAESRELSSQRNVSAQVANRWGVTSVERYFDIDHRQTSDAPYGPLTGSMIVLDLPLNEWIERSQAVVVGRVVAISPPFYNSADGGFWHEPSTEAGRSILQDLTIDVERVLGDTAGITTGNGGQIVVTIAGGQIEVSFSESIDPALLPEGFAAGRSLVEAMAPAVRVAEGDRVVLLLDREAAPWFGASVDPDMPWGKTTVAGCPAVPVGTKDIVSVAHWQLLGPSGQQATFIDRTVSLDELQDLSRRDLGKSLKDPASPISPNNMPGRPEPFDDPARPCKDTGSHPPQADATPHHPEFEE